MLKNEWIEMKMKIYVFVKHLYALSRQVSMWVRNENVLQVGLQLMF